MRTFNKIREFFWPLMERKGKKEPRSLHPNQINIDSSKLEKTLEYTIGYFESESERKRSVENKSSIFISIISVATAVILGVTSLLVKDSEFNLLLFLLIILLLILTVYMVRTIWFSLKAMERKAFHVISIEDFLIEDSGDKYYKALIAEITNKVRKNSLVINEKVNNMTMAQEYFKRAIVVISIYAFCMLFFFVSKASINYKTFLTESIGLNILNYPHLIVIYSLLLIAIILGVRANIKK